VNAWPSTGTGQPTLAVDPSDRLERQRLRDAPWDELILFCGANDGYALVPNARHLPHDPRQAVGVNAARANYRRA
jgi:hypothetical protein